MSGKAHLWIIGDRSRRGQEHQHGAASPSVRGFLDEGGADALALVRRAYGEIGEIADVSKIAERARDAALINLPSHAVTTRLAWCSMADRSRDR